MKIKNIVIIGGLISGMSIIPLCQAATTATITAQHIVEADVEFTMRWEDVGPTKTTAKNDELWGYLELTQTSGTPTYGKLSNPKGGIAPGPMKVPFDFIGPNDSKARAYLAANNAPVGHEPGDNFASGVKVGSGYGYRPFVVGTPSRIAVKLNGAQTLTPGVYQTTFNLTTWSN